MSTANDIQEVKEKQIGVITDSFDFDEMEDKLQSQLDQELADMQFLVKEKENIGSPDHLGEIIEGVIWEQFLNQVAVVAGEDFIKENNGLHLDLSDAAHIQTTENFAKGKIATHNTKIDYQKRYDDWQNNFKKDKNGNIIMHKTRTGKEEATLKENARKPFDKGRPKGSKEKHTNVDHIIPAAEIIRDPEANAHMTKEEQIAFANSEVNLNEMDSSLNQSKKDKSMTDWLDNPNSKGQKPKDIFNISDKEEAKLRQKADIAEKQYEKCKKEGEKRSIEAGRQSQREEAFRIGKTALRAVVMQLLAELIKEFIAKLVQWFKSGERDLDSLKENLKKAITSFIGKMKIHLINAGNTVFSTVATSIMGPVFRTLQKGWMIIKQGWRSLKKAIQYIKDPANKGKPVGILLLEVGKIIIAGLTGVGALLLGEVIEKGLMTIPVFAIEIPLLGSLASILGAFFGAAIAGILGAIAINWIEKKVEKYIKRGIVNAQLAKGNKVLTLQQNLQTVKEEKIEYVKANVTHNIFDRHMDMADCMQNAENKIRENCTDDKSIQEALDDIDVLLDDLKN